MREGEDVRGEGSVDNEDGEEGEESEESEESENGVEDDDDEDDANSDIARSDILISPPNNDEEEEVALQSKYVTKSSEFQMADLGHPEFMVGQKFSSIKIFRTAVRECNLNMGKYIKFKKNYLAKCIVVCRDPKCKYRLHGRKWKEEESFEIRSFQSKHTCRRNHKNSIVKSSWITNKLIEKFRAQPNMLIKAILGEVKDRWGVDVKKKTGCIEREYL
jgi:hypothetical protein